MHSRFSRRNFLRKSVATGISLGLSTTALPHLFNTYSGDDMLIGVIGLDGSHAIQYTEFINNPDEEVAKGYRVIAAYPYGSRTIENRYRRIPGYTEQIQEFGVTIVDSKESLLKMVDAVLLQTHDGNVHLAQAMECFRAGKPVFINKPLAGNLKDVLAIYKAAEEYKVPVFTSCSSRWTANAQKIRNGELIGRVMGADTYGNAPIEPSHADLFWYGVHGVEMLYTVMATGCKEVVRVYQPDTDIVVGNWDDGRLGTFRGLRSGSRGFGGKAFGEKGIHEIGPLAGPEYKEMVTEILSFFKTGIPPVSPEESIEMFAFMEAADESKRRGGQPVQLEEVLQWAGG